MNNKKLINTLPVLKILFFKYVLSFTEHLFFQTESIKRHKMDTMYTVEQNLESKTNFCH